MSSGFKASLGSDKITVPKMLRLLFLAIVATFLTWQLVNVPQYQNLSIIFMILFLLPLPFILFDLLVPKKEFIDSVLEEPASERIGIFANIPSWAIWGFALFFVGLTYFTSSTQAVSLVSAPVFQAFPFSGNPYYLAFLSGIVGIVENFFFFSFWFPTSYALLKMKTPFYVALPLSIFLVGGLLFGGFHFLVYGTAELSATLSVMIFGMMNCIIISIFRTLIITDVWHFSNNFFINIFRVVKIGFG